MTSCLHERARHKPIGYLPVGRLLVGSSRSKHDLLIRSYVQRTVSLPAHAPPEGRLCLRTMTQLLQKTRS